MPTGTITQTVEQARQMLQQGTARQEVLAYLVRAAETMAGNNAVSSILILDKDGLLRNGCSPHLPHDYLTAIDGLRPNPNVGTCAAVAATGAMVITTDFRSDDKWAELRHLPLSLGFVGAWSVPIKSPEGKILGTFGTYFRENRQPSADEIDGKKELARVVAEVLELK